MKKERIYPHSYKIIITDISEGDQKGFELHIPAFDAIVLGPTLEEVIKAYCIYFDDEVRRRKKEGIPMPKPDSKPDFIKQIPLRIPARMYQRISERAKKEGHSFNSLVTSLLEKYELQKV